MKRTRNFLLIAMAALAVLLALAGSCAASPDRAPSPQVPPPPAMEAKSSAAEAMRDDASKELAAPSASSGARADLSSAEKKLDSDSSPEASIEAAKRLSESDDLTIQEPEMLSYINGPDLEKIPLLCLDETVIITETTVRVIFDMIFENPGDKILSGTLMMSLPKGASPSYLGIFAGAGPKKEAEALMPLKGMLPDALLGKNFDSRLDIYTLQGESGFGQVQEARVVDPVKGRETYEQVTRQRVDPALSEWSGGSSFSTKVYPIAAKSRKRVIFSYDRPLPYENGAAILPLPVPQKVSATSARMTVHILSPRLKDGAITASGNNIKAAADGSFGFGLDKAWKGAALFTAKPLNPGLAVLAGVSEELNATLARVRIVPAFADSGATLLNTGKAVFLLDTSYSAKAKISGMQLKLLRSVLENDASISEFSIIAFDVRSRDISGGFVKNQKSAREELFAKLETIWLEGATDFRSALAYLSAQGYDKTADSFFLLSDGQISWGTDSVPAMKKDFATLFDARWICYGFGEEAVNTALFNELGSKKGMTVQVNLSDDIKKAALAHRSRAIAIESVSATMQEDILVSGAQKSLAPGQSIELALKAGKNQKSAEITIILSGKKYNYTVPLDVDPRTSFLACRAWADIYSTGLLAFEDTGADRAALALSQAFSLSNRAASFLILESEAEYTAYNIEPQWLSWREVAKGMSGKLSAGHRGDLDTSAIPPAKLAFAESLKSIKKGSYWMVGNPAKTAESGTFLFTTPAEKRENDWPISIYRQALAMKESKAPDASARALRTITTIAETKSQDEVSLRIAGFTLFSWGFYDDARELFARIRERRPFEAQGYMLEAVAMQAEGNYSGAATLYELILSKPWQRLDGYSKTAVKYLYLDLLTDIDRQKPGGAIAESVKKRLAELNVKDKGNGRIILFWNLDNTDVDLHVLEPLGAEVYYSNPTSLSGGKLHWDNTDGLGPELYEHRNPKDFIASVNYFGSSSVEGAPPSSTFVLSFLRSENSGDWQTGFFTTILEKPSSGKLAIVPGKWGIK